MAIVKRFSSRLNARSRASDQQSTQNHHIDKPVDESINRPEKPVNGLVNEPEKPVDGPVSETQFTLEVTVILVRNDDTPPNTISEGLVRLSRAMGAIDSLPSVKETPDETSTMASFIINALNIMATVPDKDRPEYVYSYHILGTRTGIATYFNLMSIVLKHELKSRERKQIMDDIFSAFLYFGITILRTPVPLSAYIAVALGVEVKRQQPNICLIIRNGFHYCGGNNSRCYAKCCKSREPCAGENENTTANEYSSPRKHFQQRSASRIGAEGGLQLQTRPEPWTRRRCEVV
ncbi:hypothetical protein V8F06_003785 [Rhypophila decipiens]